MEAAVTVRGETRLFPDLGYGTNNDAEWLALIAALRAAQALGVAEFVLLGDAATVIHQANGVWKCRSPALRAHLVMFEAMRGVRNVQIRKIARSQNLAGIALARR